MESAAPQVAPHVRAASWLFVGLGLLIIVGGLAAGPTSLDEWFSLVGSAGFALAFLPLARNRVPEDFFERFGAAAGCLMLNGDGEILSSLPRWYVAVPLAWTLFTAAVLMSKRPVGRGMLLLRGAGLVAMVSVAFWPDIWPADATLFRRIDVQASLAVAVFSAGMLIRRPARAAPAQPHPA